MNALRLLSDTVNNCYENAFKSVRPSSAVLNTDVAHSPLPLTGSMRYVNYRGLDNSYLAAIFMSFLYLTFICNKPKGDNY